MSAMGAPATEVLHRLLLALVADADADPAVRELSAPPLATSCATSFEDALAALDAGSHDLVVVDWAHPDGQRLLDEIRARHPEVPVIVLSSGVSEAVAAMRAGAADVVARPLGSDALRESVDKVVSTAAQAVPDPPAAVASHRRLIGESKPMAQVHAMIRRAAPGMATVLIRGESGTGKELVARAIHEQSPRAAGPFVKVQCGALPETLLESELFGHEKGAFTGATARKPGRVEVAERGTLFLDEIGDITIAMQVKLLRLLQDREYERLGSSRTQEADVRFIAATHRDLDALVKKGEFREDLYYRLNVLPLWLPPLRARRDDIPLLSQHFCEVFGAANGRPEARLGDDALAALRKQRWPGNVRQLQNFLERLVILSADELITRDDVERELAQNQPFSTQVTSATPGTPGSGPVLPLNEELMAAERKALLRALEHTKGNRSVAARILGVSRATLYKKMNEHGLL